MSSKSYQSNTHQVIIYIVWSAVSATLHLQEGRRRGYSTLCILYIMYITVHCVLCIFCILQYIVYPVYYVYNDRKGWQGKIMNGNPEDESYHNTAHLQTVVNIILFKLCNKM